MPIHCSLALSRWQFVDRVHTIEITIPTGTEKRAGEWENAMGGSVSLMKNLVKGAASLELKLLVGFAVVGCALPAIAAPSDIYTPKPLPASNAVSDEITVNDIPTGAGSFARDYRISVKTGDRLEIELTSDEFDTMVMLIAGDGTTLVENDDRGDGTTHSRIFTSIEKEGEYTIRVQAFGNSTGGKFDLKVTRLRAL